jgi:zinc and cadmium transporter
MSTELPYWVAALYGVLAAAAILLGGGLVGPFRARGLEARSGLAALGAGFLLALGALGALPEALEQAEAPLVPLLLALASFGGMLLLHRFGHGDPHTEPPHHGHDHGHGHGHDHGQDDHEHAPGQKPSVAHHAHAHTQELSLYDAHLAVAGLTLHSLLDGVAVSAALASQHELGVLVAVFVLLHKLPEGATAAALTLASGGQAQDVRRNVLVVALASLLGALAVFVVGPYLVHALAITAGVTSGVAIGIAGHLLRHDRTKPLLGLLAGVALFAVSELLLHQH